MAERSFSKEVQKLYLGDGEVFRGEGILAVTKALLQSGVSYVAGYQGAPISHLMDVLTDANEILEELGVHFEHSASEATAAATLAASVNYPLRGAVTFKSTVGTNVASDALANLASGGVMGGALIIVGEDYGDGSSIMQERSHAFAMKSQMWLLDPRPNLPSIVRAVEEGFALSEATNTPVMLELRIRACHVHGQFEAKHNVRPTFTLKDAIEHPVRDVSRIVLPPASFLHEQEKIRTRWPAAQQFIQDHALNEVFGPDARTSGSSCKAACTTRPSARWSCSGLSDAFGESQVPLYVLNVTYPLVDAEVARFCTVQACGARDRGGPARFHRAEPARDSAQGRARHGGPRQGHAADGWRIHRGGRGQRDSRLRGAIRLGSDRPRATCRRCCARRRRLPRATGRRPMWRHRSMHDRRPSARGVPSVRSSRR